MVILRCLYLGRDAPPPARSWALFVYPVRPLFPRGPAPPGYKVKQRGKKMAVARFPALESSCLRVTNHSLPVFTGLDAPGARHGCTDLHSLWGTQRQESFRFHVPSPLPPVPGGTEDCRLGLFGRPGIRGSVLLDCSWELPLPKGTGHSHLHLLPALG